MKIDALAWIQRNMDARMRLTAIDAVAFGAALFFGGLAILRADGRDVSIAFASILWTIRSIVSWRREWLEVRYWRLSAAFWRRSAATNRRQAMRLIVMVQVANDLLGARHWREKIEAAQ